MCIWYAVYGVWRREEEEQEGGGRRGKGGWNRGGEGVDEMEWSDGCELSDK